MSVLNCMLPIGSRCKNILLVIPYCRNISTNNQFTKLFSIGLKSKTETVDGKNIHNHSENAKVIHVTSNAPLGHNTTSQKDLETAYSHFNFGSTNTTHIKSFDKQANSIFSHIQHFPSHKCIQHRLLHSSCRRSLQTSHPTAAIYIIDTDEEFENKVMNSPLPVVVNFHADWCEPCHALKPLLEGLADQFEGKMHLAEVKVDDHVSLLQAFEVTAVPAVLGVVGGQVTEKFVGLISEKEVRAFVNTMIGQ